METTMANLQSRVDVLGRNQSWNHNYVLPNGVQTKPGVQTSHGKNQVKWERIKPILEALDLKNKSVLDVGCNEGFFSMKLSEMGARVQGIDADSNRIEKAQFAHEVLGIKNTKFDVIDIYSENFAKLPSADVCICLGFLHRIPDPFTAMSRISQKTNIILFEWKALKFGPHNESFAYYTPGNFVEDDFYGTPYWIMSFKCVEEIMKRLGYKYFYRVDDPGQKRAILVAGRIQHPLFEQKAKIMRVGRVMTTLRHTKRYLKTLKAIANGEINS